MPFAAVERPSIALGLLQSELKGNGLECCTLYPNLRWAERLGLEVHEAMLGSLVEDLAGEWVFAEKAFGPQVINEEYVARVVRLSALFFQKDGAQSLRQARSLASPFVDEVAQEVLRHRPKIVGCTSMFQQNCASLALLRRLKELDPSVITVMGGANCEGPMGLAIVRHFDWVDYVVSGDADQIVTPFFRALLEGRQEFPYGVLSRDFAGEEPPRANFTAMDQTAIPNYDDYFQALRATQLDPLPALMVETSRGCWWGKKHHCTFCGLNGGGMDYRSKSMDRVLGELRHLSDRYQISSFVVVDNILDLGYLKSVMPVLAERGGPYGLFFETKSNLKRDQLELLRSAGVRWIQPGIESLHDRILELMDKGSTALMNVQLLRNSRELGINVTWNLLVSLPGEKDEWYQEMAAWIPMLFHLQPPIGFSRIHYDRFSPYHKNPAAYGIRITPAHGYGEVYPLPEEALSELAYFFQDHPDEMDRGDRCLPTPGRRAVYMHLKNWSQAFAAGTQLTMTGDAQALAVHDTRPDALDKQFALSGRAAELLLQCQTPRRFAEPEAALRELLEKKLILQIEDRYLSLPTHGQLAPLPANWQHPLGMAQRAPAAPRYQSRLANC